MTETGCSLKIVINAVPLAFGGARTVGVNLIRTLPTAGPKHKFRALIPAGVGYEEACLQSGIEFKVYSRSLFYPIWRIWFDQVGVQRQVRKWGADVLFTLGNLGPIWPEVPHAILFMHPYYIYPLSLFHGILPVSQQLKMVVHRRLFRRSLTRASAIMPQTDVAAIRLQQQYSVPAAKLHVIPPAITLEHAERGGEEGPVGGRIRQYANGRMVLLCLTRYYPHKNIECLVQTAGRLREQGIDSFAFVITIAEDQGPGARALMKAIESQELTDRILNLGPVDFEDLADVYRASDALFFPTLLESFSGSYLEAMHYGLPIFTTDIDFARYVCGDAALYFDPEDLDGIVNLLETFIEAHDVADTLRANGHRQVACFGGDWFEKASRYLRVLETISECRTP